MMIGRGGASRGVGLSTTVCLDVVDLFTKAHRFYQTRSEYMQSGICIQIRKVASINLYFITCVFQRHRKKEGHDKKILSKR